MHLLPIIFGLLGLVFLIALISVLVGVPYLSVHREQAKKMMELANIKPGVKAVDLGSGTGNLLFLAAELGATTTGYELNPFLVLVNIYRIWKRGLKDKVNVKMASLYKADLSGVDVVFAFLLPGPMAKLEKKLFSELKPGALILSYAFPMLNRTPIKKEEGIFVYKV